MTRFDGFVIGRNGSLSCRSVSMARLNSGALCSAESRSIQGQKMNRGANNTITTTKAAQLATVGMSRLARAVLVSRSTVMTMGSIARAFRLPPGCLSSPVRR